MENELKFHLDKHLPKANALKLRYLRDQVSYLKTLPQHEQKSDEWYAMRLTMLSASDWGTILGDNHYAKPDSVLLKKCGEESYFPQAALKAMAWGNKYEDVAISIYEHRNSTKVYEFGCIRHPDINFLGASPDGITNDGVMLEIKCPTSRKITGTPPRYYWCQVQGQLEVCDLDRCDFLECKLKEYDDEEEYLNDHYENNQQLNKFGHEKGVIAAFYIVSQDKYKYYYSPVNILGQELEDWKKWIKEEHEVKSKNVKDRIIFYSYDYWYLEEVSCVPIFRNAEWFNDAKFKLEDFWEEVCYYREMGLEFLKNTLNEEKEEKRKIKEEKKELKKKEEENKKQKKIRDFINLSDVNNKNEDNTKKVSIKDDSSSSDCSTKSKKKKKPRKNESDSDLDISLDSYTFNS